jgi:hypothetical protein
MKLFRWFSKVNSLSARNLVCMTLLQCTHISAHKVVMLLLNSSIWRTDVFNDASQINSCRLTALDGRSAGSSMRDADSELPKMDFNYSGYFRFLAAYSPWAPKILDGCSHLACNNTQKHVYSYLQCFLEGTFWHIIVGTNTLNVWAVALVVYITILLYFTVGVYPMSTSTCCGLNGRFLFWLMCQKQTHLLMVQGA